MTRLVLILIFAACFTLATVLDSRMQELKSKSSASTSVMAAMLGDSRRMFANQFFVKADAYFHSGYYPTIFDTPTEGHEHLNGEPDTDEEHHDGHHEEEGDFLGKPRDWIEAFGRHFFPTVHTHLSNGNEREILPWLRLSADMDPTRIQTYLTASYWLRNRLNKSPEAEQFLREGLRANPDSYEILLELGRIYAYDKKDTRVGRNLWDLAAQKWKKQDAAGLKPDAHAYEEILGEYVRLDKQQNNLNQLLVDLEALKAVSPNKESIEKTIRETQAKLSGAPTPAK